MMKLKDLLEVFAGEAKINVGSQNENVKIYKNPSKEEFIPNARGIILTNGDLYIGIAKNVIHVNIIDAIVGVGVKNKDHNMISIEDKSFPTSKSVINFIPVTLTSDGRYIAFSEIMHHESFMSTKSSEMNSIIKKYYKNNNIQFIPVNVTDYNEDKMAYQETIKKWSKTGIEIN